MSREVKLLLLGAGASGKSTVLKQMRFLHNKPFSADEVEDYRYVKRREKQGGLQFERQTPDEVAKLPCSDTPSKIIFHNVVAGMEEIIDTLDSEGTQVEPQNRQYIRVADHEYPLRTDEPFPPAYLVPLQKLWADKAVADIWSRGYEYVLHENMG
jgi:guanine nucleotide-binding protein subunit alpha